MQAINTSKLFVNLDSLVLYIRCELTPSADCQVVRAFIDALEEKDIYLDRWDADIECPDPQEVCFNVYSGYHY